MTAIRRLDAETVGQIAAGEVIERPVSVVKELVENALDAGATRVSIAVRGGGFDAIEVVDDGAGIAPDDLPLALAPHATSKLRDAAELAALATLGFRGEGLASIAAVARVRIVSRRAAGGDEVGAAIEAGPGEWIGPVEPSAAPTGTRVSVRDLFANVPVRREYLRSASAEFTRISGFLATLALGYPRVAFALSHDGKPTWTFPPASSARDRLAHVFGRSAYDELLPLAQLPATMHGRIDGFISRPGAARGDRRMQVLFVNGRLLRSSLLAGAWTAGYATFAMSGRHPFGVLFIDLPPEHVDPNVHPTKSDVRLRYAAQVGDVARRQIAATLRAHAARELDRAVSFAPVIAAAGDGIDASTAPRGAGPDAMVVDAPDLGGAAGGAAKALRVLAQLDRTFILASDGDALVLVDQHAAHERIAFEALAKAAEGAASPSEPLLIPLVFELSAADAERFAASLDALRAGGLDVEPFGERTYRITAMPAGIRARRIDVRGYLDDLGDEVRGLSARERVWASLACHSVVRAGEPLEPLEMATLLERLRSCENPMHCPHGRPTIVRIEPGEIARLFKRA